MQSGGKVNVTDLGIASDVYRPKEKRDKFSGFFVTINTNVAPVGEGNDDCANKLRQALKYMFKTEDGLKRIIKFIDGVGTWDDIDKVDGQFVVEKGALLHRIHAHAIIKFRHHTKIHLNPAEIKVIVKDYFDRGDGTGCSISGNPHVDIKLIGGDGNLEMYLSKGLPYAGLKAMGSS